MATIDVLLPVLNSLPFLRSSIDSVLAQTFPDWRLLILDHGSTDGTVELAAQYCERDNRIVLFTNSEAEGLAGLLNYGLDKADCKIVIRQDGDDVSLPNRFEVTLDMFSTKSDLVVVAGEAEVIDVEGQPIGYLNQPGSSAEIAAATLFSNPIVHPAAAFNLRCLNDFGARYGDDFLRVLPGDVSIKVQGLAEDYLLFGQLALLGRCANVKAPLIRYRYHANSESVSKRSAQIDCAVRISRFLARSFSAMKGVPDFDPAPFCSHAECVFDFGLSDYSVEFDRMAQAMLLGFGDFKELRRELAFRRILSQRSAGVVAPRFLQFATTHGWRVGEYRTIRNWLVRRIKNSHIVSMEGGVAPWRRPEVAVR